MSTSNLPFQFLYRSRQFLRNESVDDQIKAEENLRDLEEFLATVGTGGGSSTLNGTVLGRWRFGNVNSTLFPDGGAPQAQTLVRPTGTSFFILSGLIELSWALGPPNTFQYHTSLRINTTDYGTGSGGTNNYAVTNRHSDFGRVDISGVLTNRPDYQIIPFHFYFNHHLLEDAGISESDSFTCGVNDFLNPGGIGGVTTINNATLQIFSEA